MARKINYKAKLWKVFSQYIRLSYADENGMVRCVTCNTLRHWKDIHAGHYVPKSRGLAVYFEERNVHPQCAGCNTFGHGTTDKYAIYMQKKYGPNILEELDKLSREVRKIYTDEYIEMINHYSEKVKGYDL